MENPTSFFFGLAVEGRVGQQLQIKAADGILNF